MSKAYFQGWYFKLQGGEKTLALIPAMHKDGKGNASASLQIITPTQAFCVPFPYEQYTQQKMPFTVGLGNNFFSETGLELDITTSELTIKGVVSFRQITPIAYDIMGPFRYVPFMECRHSVFSMTHGLEGNLTLNGEKYCFDRGTGYIEGDRGHSFPKEYAWSQCNFYQNVPCSIMLSVADIPLAGMHFTGVISVILWEGKEYRLATYLGAKAVAIGKGTVTIKQGAYTLTAQLLTPNNTNQGHSLQAPVAGAMTRLIRESPSCKAYYHFSKGGKTLFSLHTDRAAFEYEYEK